MPYDEGNRTWKLPVITSDGTRAGLLPFTRDLYRDGGVQVERFATKEWRGRPKDGCCNKLFTWGTESRDNYYLLLGPAGPDLTDDHYCRHLRPEDAIKWLEEERYAIPEDLAEQAALPGAVHTPTAVLTPALQEVWDALDGHALLAKQLATELMGSHSHEDAIRKRVAKLRDQGFVVNQQRGVGYWRPDAPPGFVFSEPTESSVTSP